MVKIRERKKKKSKEALQKDVIRFVNNNFNDGKNTQNQ